MIWKCDRDRCVFKRPHKNKTTRSFFIIIINPKHFGEALIDTMVTVKFQIIKSLETLYHDRKFKIAHEKFKFKNSKILFF
jgi:hypothetical protein